MYRTRGRLAVACLAVLGAAIAVAGGSAGNRDGVVTFKAEPGPGSVTYGENIAYSSTFDNTSGSVFTQVRYVQTRPSATLGGSTYTAELVKTSCATGSIDTKGDSDPTNDEFVCNLGGQLGPDDAPARVVVVWGVPANIASAEGCASCLKTKGFWLIKERKATNGNEIFPKEGPIEVSAQLLGGQGSNETLRAGGYELGACSGGNKSLSTNQAVNASDNPVASSFCLPAFATTGVNVGIATTITEQANNAHTSEVCIAELGTNCGDSTYVAKNFSPDTVGFEFRVAAGALPKGYKITQVFHNSSLLPSCAVNPTNANGCVVSIDLDNKTKIWTILARAETNGPWDW